MASQSATAERLVERLNERAAINGRMYQTHRRISEREHGQGQRETAQMHRRIAQNHAVLRKLDRLVIEDMLALCAELGINVRLVQKETERE